MPTDRYARVIIDRSIQRELDYLVPETLAGKYQCRFARARAVS